MNVSFNSNGTASIDDCRITFRDFAGEKRSDGKSTFSIIIPNQEIANEFMNRGYPVKVWAPADNPENVTIHLPVLLKFGDTPTSGPDVILSNGNRLQRVEYKNRMVLDKIAIERVDIDIRLFNWVRDQGKRNETSGWNCYTNGIKIYQKFNRFGAELAAQEMYTE